MIIDPRKLRLDATSNAFFERELEVVKSKTYDILYPDLMASTFVPVSSEVDRGATSVTYQQFDRSGRAKIIGSNAKDLPRVDVLGTEFNRPVRWAGASYGFSLQEIWSAMLAGRPLDARKAAAARRSVDETLDEVASVGAPDHGIATGFINNAAVPVTNAAALWSAATAQDIVGDFSLATQRIQAASLGRFTPNVFILPVAQYAQISTTPLGDNNDKTILDFIMANFPQVEAILPWYRLAGAGVGAVDRMIAYVRSPEVLTQDVPMDFFQLPPQEQGLEQVVNTVGVTAGTSIYYPIAVDYTDTI